MEKSWVLIANSERARCLERDGPNHPLRELADFVHPHSHLSGQASGSGLTGLAGKGHGRTAHAGTQFELRTPSQEKLRHVFAQQLAAFLNDAAANKRYTALALIANSPMLGELTPLLAPSASLALKRSVAKDLTQLSGMELKKAVERALELPD